jgi:hypothetical protein
MKEHQELQETYVDLLNETTDLALVQLIQKLDGVANEPRPPISLNWTTFNALYNKKVGIKQMHVKEDGQSVQGTHSVFLSNPSIKDHQWPSQLVSTAHVAPKIISVKQRRLRWYGLSLIAAVVVIGLVIFVANTILGNVAGGRSAGIRMQLAVVENGIAPSPAVLEKAITILSARFSQFGLEGSNVSLKQANGQSTILVTLPSFGSNEQQAVDKLLEPGKIGFWDTGSKVLARGTNFNAKDYARYNPGDQPRFTNRDINLDSLSVSENVPLNIYAINLTMQNEAITRYAHFTGSHLGDTLTIVLDGKVMMSAMIEDEIPSGEAGITDNFTLSQANAVVAALKSGVLPVELRKLN